MESMEMLRNLSDAQKDAYMNLERVFDSKGWQSILKDLESQLQSSNTVVANAKSWEDYKYSQGYRDCLINMVNLRERAVAEFESLAEDNKQDKPQDEVKEEVQEGEEEVTESRPEFL